jgi:hypothetical protein
MQMVFDDVLSDGESQQRRPAHQLTLGERVERFDIFWRYIRDYPFGSHRLSFE